MTDIRKTYRVPLGDNRGTIDVLLDERDLERYPGAVLIDDAPAEKAARAPRNKARTPENK